MKPIKKLKEILKGWKNYLGNNQEVKPLSDYRLEICTTCPLETNGVCNRFKKDTAVTTFLYNGEVRTKGTTYQGCGCPLKAKTANPDSHCPLGKW